MRAIPNPCFGCRDRKAECFKGCQRWAAYLEKRDAIYKERQMERMMTQFNDERHERITKAIQRKVLHARKW